LARGYLNRPDLTAEKFVANPFSDDAAAHSTLREGPPAGARIYRTGDAARFTGQGNLEFLGRLDHQIKIRGFRIELGEIEATLAAHPSVRAAVVAVQDDAGDRRLVGYVVPSTEKSDELATELQRFLKRRLPDYMAPADFVFLEALPLTPSGKINRRALPAPDHSTTELRQSHVPPRTEVEKQLAEIWSAVLKRASVGVEDNFFELGGHSLLATQLISRIRSVFKIELPLRYLFDSPTVAGLAVGIVEFEKKAATNIPAAITRDAREAEDLLARIDELTDEQVEALLSETLG